MQPFSILTETPKRPIPFSRCTMAMVVRLFTVRPCVHARTTHIPFLGSTVAKFAGQNVHRRLVQEESYKEGNYAEALKRAFLGTDEDLLASASLPCRSRCCT